VSHDSADLATTATTAVPTRPVVTPDGDRRRADVIPLDRARPAASTSDRAAARSRRSHPAGSDRVRRGDRGPGPTRPDPRRLAILLVTAHEEVLGGRRPYPQLAALLSPCLARRVAAELRLGRHRDRPPCTIVNVVVAPPTPTGAHEVTVLTEREGRVGAVALRLERHRGLWRATEMTRPESGYAPLPTASDPRPAGDRPDAFDDAEREAAVAGVTAERTAHR
jgi:hypothetical protein